MIEFTQKNIIDVCLGTKTIQAGYFGTTLVYQKSAPGPSTYPYITLKANANSTIGLTSKSTNQTLEYSTDKTNWNTMDTSTSISLNTGDKVYVRGVLSANNSSSDYTQFSILGNVKVSGNINAVWNYQDLTASLKQYCGYSLFYGCTGLYDISDLQLPATSLSSYCYSSMFRGCTGLTSIPSGLLPATSLGNHYNGIYCYSYMFSGCTGLTSIPSGLLPATRVNEYCYSNMFRGCTGLTSIPSGLLPATTLDINTSSGPHGYGCYSGMFRGCTGLTSIPSGLLPALRMVSYCYSGMFYGCTTLTTIPTNLLPATTLANSCYMNMFYGCTSLTTAPDLPASTLSAYCYNAIFSNCSNLNYVKCLATDISALDCTLSWLYGVAANGTFVKNASMTGWGSGSNGIPSGWTVQNA